MYEDRGSRSEINAIRNTTSIEAVDEGHSNCVHFAGYG